MTKGNALHRDISLRIVEILVGPGVKQNKTRDSPNNFQVSGQFWVEIVRKKHEASLNDKSVHSLQRSWWRFLKIEGGETSFLFDIVCHTSLKKNKSDSISSWLSYTLILFGSCCARMPTEGTVPRNTVTWPEPTKQLGLIDLGHLCPCTWMTPLLLKLYSVHSLPLPEMKCLLDSYKIQPNECNPWRKFTKEMNMAGLLFWHTWSWKARGSLKVAAENSVREGFRRVHPERTPQCQSINEKLHFIHNPLVLYEWVTGLHFSTWFLWTSVEFGISVVPLGVWLCWEEAVTHCETLLHSTKTSDLTKSITCIWSEGAVFFVSPKVREVQKYHKDSLHLTC